MAPGSRPQYRVLVEQDVPMQTRDGVTLRADVYRPDAPGRFPVLLSRLPYNKNLRPRPGDIDYFVERGYGVIMQDTLLTPDQVYELTIDLWATSHVFLPGHRVRLEISSSNFPRFDRNVNTGEDQATGSRWQTAAQTIFHDQRYPSHLLLPVIPR